MKNYKTIPLCPFCGKSPATKTLYRLIGCKRGVHCNNKNCRLGRNKVLFYIDEWVECATLSIPTYTFLFNNYYRIDDIGVIQGAIQDYLDKLTLDMELYNVLPFPDLSTPSNIAINLTGNDISIMVVSDNHISNMIKDIDSVVRIPHE